MKKKFLHVFLLAILIIPYSCHKSEKVKFESTGKINQLLLVMDNEDWKGSLGDTVRKYFAADVLVLPQREPLFTINQIPPEVYDKNFFILRNILMIEKGDKAGLKLIRDAYAKPQIIVKVTGRNNREISELLAQKAHAVIDSFKKNDLNVLQSRFKKKDLVDDTEIEKTLGISVQIPNTYKKITARDGFFWYREDLPFGSKNLIFYSVPYQNPDSVADRIPQIRDSIGKKFIPGPLPNTWMVTESTFSPVQQKVVINGVETIESRGLWEIKNDYMGGPYLNYLIPLPDKSKIIIAEGFIYLPSENKRNLLTELEAILKTIRPVTVQ